MISIKNHTCSQVCDHQSQPQQSSWSRTTFRNIMYLNFIMIMISSIHIPARAAMFVSHTYTCRKIRCQWKLFADESTTTKTATNTTKTIRIKRARRKNHAFQHLYRHDVVEVGDLRDSVDRLYVDSFDYLVTSGGFSDDEVKQMAHNFPPLLSLDIERHLKPKMKFLKHTLGGGATSSYNKREDGVAKVNRLSQIGKGIPPQFFGARLERTVAPRHAFLMANNLPHGITLLQNDCELLKEFLSVRSSKQFTILCNQWRRRFLMENRERPLPIAIFSEIVLVSDIDVFNTIFQRGLMAAARNELIYKGNNQLIDADYVIKLLVSNGGNPRELDIRGISLIHWASGIGNIKGVKALIPYFGGAEQAISLRAATDESTILHWSAAGANQKDFGCGGHIELCTWFIDLAKTLEIEAISEAGTSALDSMEFFLDDSSNHLSNVVNAVTAQGNSVLMWAAWSASLDIVKLLIENGADTSLRNNNGCTVAHWSASGGHLPTCKYLAEYAVVDFDIVNNGGNSPLSHAVAFGRAEVVSWLQQHIGHSGKGDDGRAALLAKDFVEWEGDDEKRKEIMEMFADFI